MNLAGAMRVTAAETLNTVKFFGIDRPNFKRDCVKRRHFFTGFSDLVRRKLTP